MDPDKLGGVSCLMMSDTGMFLNFDPAWATISTERRARLLHEWEQKFEESLRDIERNELECYSEVFSLLMIIKFKFGSGRKKDVFFIRGMYFLLLSLGDFALTLLKICQIVSISVLIQLFMRLTCSRVDQSWFSDLKFFLSSFSQYECVSSFVFCMKIWVSEKRVKLCIR